MMSIVATRLQQPSARRSSHLVERNVLLYRRDWIVMATGLVEPLLYLLGIGFGVGGLVGSVSTGNGQHVPYAVFVAPAMMATSAMNGAVYETTFNFFHKLKYIKLYDAVLATPLGVADIALGEVTWALTRGTIYALGFLVIMALLGLVKSPLGILALPAAMLIGFAFSAVGTAASTFVRTWQDFNFVLAVMVPLFLFSATFYPLSLYPGWLQVVTQVTPLYHGVDLLRSLTTGSLTPAVLVDLVYLVILATLGLAISTVRLQKLLLK
jgi:lipooligosaccharide transport system permease protein